MLLIRRLWDVISNVISIEQLFYAIDYITSKLNIHSAGELICAAEDRLLQLGFISTGGDKGQVFQKRSHLKSAETNTRQC